MTKDSAAPRWTLACWLAAALIWFAPLGYRDLAHPDEGRYSEISREMLATGDWVTPRLDGLKYFEKPPLQYWASAISFAAFGLNEFAARLFTALTGFLTIVAVWFTARRVWGPEAGALSAIATASMTWLMAVSHVITLDMGVSFFLTLALCGFMLAQNRPLPAASGAAPEPDPRWMWLVWAAMAGATLTKGLIGILIPGAVLVLYSLICRQWRLWLHMEWIVGLVIFFGLTTPWFVLVSMRNPEFAHFFFIHEHLERYLTNEHHREGAPWYFVPILVGGLLPWTTLAPQFLKSAWTEAGEARNASRLLLIWSAFVFLFFSASGSKLPGYILPMFPALGLLLGRYLAQVRADVLRPHARFTMILWALIGLAAPIVVRFLSTKNTPESINLALAPWAIAAAAAYVLGSALSYRAAKRGSRLTSALWLGAGSLVALQCINGGYQEFSPIKSAKAIAADAAPHIDDATELFVIRGYDQTLPFYLQRTLTPVEFFDELTLGEEQEPDKHLRTLDEFRARWRSTTRAVAFTSPQEMKALQASGLPMRVISVHIRWAAFAKP